MFAAEFEPAETNGRRRSPRAPVSLDARIGRGGLDRTLCRVVDLSPFGARLQTYSALRVGTMIWLTLPQVGPVAASIIWSDDFAAGCQFQEPIGQDAYDALIELDQTTRKAG
ncbi:MULTISPECIES: PilZ domain-containing protein [unclassified Sphingomonas]|uniref:PilZ domain-containing protein n=1 Tax=unclassified Sphingomonas TaxID=196159 RepID=UPI000BCE66C1|nr:MAG: pilus assembly protein PilZ [Sphingomonas sp. 12-62-6]OYX36998.1 MAG: pilus assembly protein PilZ [Sphingomonas sp. 32-62-10]OYY66851.1 MAG: pilus assembly protein PilZ [Sphingomonas sp. 28-62-11]